MSRRVFFCYARENQDFALQLAEHLKKRGVPIWLDQWDIPPEADWDKTIDTALHDCAHLLIVLSRVSVESREVRGELRTALDLGKPVLPVLHEHCEIPRQLRVVQFVDFTNRQPDDEDALNQLVRVCTGEAPAPGASRTERRNPKWTWPRLAGLRGLGMRSKVLLSSVLAMLVVGLLWFGVDALTAERRRLNDAALSPDGSYLATANGQGLGVRGTVRIWEVSSGRELSLISNKGPAWSADGRYLASASKDNTVQFWDGQRFSLIRRVSLGGQFNSGTSLAWSADGTRLAAGDSASVRILSAQSDTGQQKLTERADDAYDSVEIAGWSADGTRLGSFSRDERTARVWDTATANLLATFRIGVFRSIAE